MPPLQTPFKDGCICFICISNGNFSSSLMKNYSTKLSRTSSHNPTFCSYFHRQICQYVNPKTNSSNGKMCLELGQPDLTGRPNFLLITCKQWATGGDLVRACSAAPGFYLSTSSKSNSNCGQLLTSICEIWTIFPFFMPFEKEKKQAHP